jgi:hypothetical protein
LKTGVHLISSAGDPVWSEVHFKTLTNRLKLSFSSHPFSLLATVYAELKKVDPQSGRECLKMTLCPSMIFARRN